MHENRPSTAPDFLLSRATGSVRTQGAQTTYTNPWQAADALRAGRHEMVVGALPFNLDEVAALTVPTSIIREPRGLQPHEYYRNGTLTAQIASFDPTPEEHLRRVEAAVATIQSSRLEKVVLARAVDINFPDPIDPRLVAARLIDNSFHRDGFIADLTPAGRTDAMIVGCSPEVLIRRHGMTVSAFPLAGSAPRVADPLADAAKGHTLINSDKDLREHSYVVEHLQDLLAPVCSTLEASPTPELLKTTEMWHLGTHVTGTLKDPAITALDLALRVHPTPAICGTPTAAAEALIHTAETDRGFYAGAVGWCDSTGDGEYMVAIRCAEVAGDGRSARTWAGGGIVADSDPQEELEETTAKLRTILASLGL